jgi:hypothetical protein
METLEGMLSTHEFELGCPTALSIIVAVTLWGAFPGSEVAGDEPLAHFIRSKRFKNKHEPGLLHDRL